MPLSNALNLIKKYAKKEEELLKQGFLSCYMPGVYDVFANVSGVRRKFYVDEDFTEHGIAYFEPVDCHKAKLVRQAEEYEAREYLGEFEHLKVIAVYDLGEVWITLPANYQAAKQRFDLNKGKFVIVRNSEGVQPFDFVDVRCIDDNFWFYDVDYAMDAEVSITLRENFEAKKKDARVKNSTPECRDAYKLAFKLKNKLESLTVEEKIVKTLAETQSTLVSYMRKKNKLIEIVWKSKGGQQYTSHISEVDFSVISAGICLGGTDQGILNLKSLPSVVSQGERDRLIYRTLGRGNDYDDDYYEDDDY